MRTRRRDRANASNSALAFCDRRTQMQGEHFSHFLALKTMLQDTQQTAFGFWFDASVLGDRREVLDPA